MKYALTDNGQKILNYLKEVGDGNVTAADIAKDFGVKTNSMDAAITAGLVKKGYAERVMAEIELEDGTHKAVKFIKLTEAGKNYDHEAAMKKDIEAMVQKG